GSAGGSVGRIPIMRCLPQICVAFGEAGTPTLDKFRKGSAANFIIYEAPGIGMPIKISLNGFAAAYTAIGQLLSGPTTLMVSLLEKAQVSRSEATLIPDSALKGADDGELFVEQRLSEHAVFDDGRLKSASFDEAQGFGLRVVSGETQGYSHSTEVSAAARSRASDVCRSIIAGPSSGIWAAPSRTNRQLYVAQNPSE